LDEAPEKRKRRPVHDGAEDPLLTTILTPRHSSVLETPAADPKTASAHFAARLAFETDPSDVAADLAKGATGFIMVDCRSPESYAKGHIAGAINIPYRTMDKETTARLPKDKTIITYCSNASCNASTKGALRLSDLGFRVKEMLGGYEAWSKKGYPTAAGTAAGDPTGRMVLA
jgi:rhodanese-related sulfurtransferase